jgi:DNA-binding FadR family transcriptional regulator
MADNDLWRGAAIVAMSNSSVKTGRLPAGTPGAGLTTAAMRTLLTSVDGSRGRADQLAGRLSEAIRLGLFPDGGRLPAEPQFAEQLGVSTATLREALAILRERDLVTTRRGRHGGTFVRAPADRHAPLERFSIQELRDLGDQRCAVAGTAARLAAERALPQEIHRLEEQVGRLAAAGTPSERRRADTQFTIEVAAAAQSPRLTHEEARLRAEIGELLELSLDDHDHGALVGERRRLVEAIAGRRPELARDLAERHVQVQTERLIQLRLQPHAPEAGGSHPDIEELLGQLAEELERVFTALGELGARFAGLVATHRSVLGSEDLASLRPTILAMLRVHGGLVTGAGIVTAPGLLADTPRWLEWWWTGGRGTPEALRVNLDPSAPDFYDYTTTDWYSTPSRTGLPTMAGPYADHACTDEYAITLSSPVFSGEGALLGMAAADVLVARLEGRLLPALAALERPAALTSGDGRVIASSSPTLLPGQRLDPGQDRARSLSTQSPMHAWRLVEM